VILKLVVAAYLLAAAALPFAHHDLLCHFTSHTHCASCQVGTSGEDSSAQSGLPRVRLTDAGVAGEFFCPEWVTPATTVASGRAPPSTPPSA
jgi:hypothetical protein